MAPKFAHIGPFLKELHERPDKFWMEFKILLLIFQVVHGFAPQYLRELIQIREPPNYYLRTNNEVLL